MIFSSGGTAFPVLASSMPGPVSIGIAAALGGLLLLLVVAFLTVVLRQRLKMRRLAADAEIREARHRVYRELLESSRVPLLLIDNGLVCRVANPACARLFGLEPATLIGRDLMTCLDPRDREAWRADLLAALAGGTRRRTFAQPTANGERLFEADLGGGSSSPNLAVVSFRDVTVQRLTEEALARRESELQAIFQTGPECVKVVDRDGRLQRINPAGLAMIEADDLEQGLATRIENLVVEEDRDAYLEFTGRVLNGEGGKLQYRGIGLKGTLRWVETHAVPMRDAQGRITSALAISRDISERHRLAAELGSAIGALDGVFAKLRQAGLPPELKASLVGAEATLQTMSLAAGRLLGTSATRTT